MKTPLLFGGVLALSLATAGCSGTDGAADNGQKNLDLATWWSQKSELDAIDAVIAMNHAKHPDVNITVLTAKSLQALGSDVQSRLALGTPPTAFQANLGGNAQQWKESALPLNGRAKRWGADAFQSSILDRVSVGSDIIAVPLALTRQNNAYYNLKVLSSLGLDIPKGRDELETWLAALADKGYTHPLCLGDAFNWVSAHALFEDIVPAYMGAEHAQKFWSGQLSADDQLFGEALDYAASLNAYWNTDFISIDWVPGLERLMEDRDPSEQCLLTPMGDWGGAVLSGDYVVDQDFAQRSWPGAEDLWVIAGDAFVTTQGVKYEDEALDFFDTLASEEGQIAFNSVKGSVPARTLSAEQRSQFGPLTQANMVDLSNATALPAFKVIGSSTFPWDDLSRLTHDFLLVGDKQPIIDFIAKNYDRLAP
ncbi:MAG TPA: ABC transporter substrate-binding protein [Polyangiaceae bacterium]|nr:ABC transporter substrate-binding protein [Polyangiaceae bacterium]